MTGQILIFILVATSAWIIVEFVVPFIVGAFRGWNEKRAEKTAERYEHMFIAVNSRKLAILYSLAPIITGIAGLVIFRSFVGLFLCAIAGLVFPAIRLKQLEYARFRKFSQQLADGIMILSSCLKGGLSLVQAIEALVEEMPAPISQEFAIVVKEHKMGVALEESLARLSQRMPSEDLNLMFTAILVSRETGGNLPEVFSRLVTTIRSKANINETIQTMTLQGKVQGIVLSILPFVFSVFIYKTQPQMVDQMFKTDAGRMMLMIAAVLQIIGIVLIRIFSRAEV